MSEYAANRKELLVRAIKWADKLDGYEAEAKIDAGAGGNQIERLEQELRVVKEQNVQISKDVKAIRQLVPLHQKQELQLKRTKDELLSMKEAHTEVLLILRRLEALQLGE